METSGSAQQPNMAAALDSTSWKLIFQGAEARVYEAPSPTGPCVVKQRMVKRYRHDKLDSRLNKARLKGEVRGLLKASKAGVQVPRVDYVDETNLLVVMEKIKGRTVKQVFDDVTLATTDKTTVARMMGEEVAKLHNAGMCHGDLTTSNAMVHGDGPNIELPPYTHFIMIDFGLASNTKSNEDFAVDLYVLERAFISSHPNSEQFFNTVLESYIHARGHAAGMGTKKVFDEVRARGRKRTAFG